MPNDDARTAAREALVVLRSRVDAHFDAAVHATPEAFRCAAGCDSCCHRRFGVFEIEAGPIRDALETMQRRDPAMREQIRRQATAPSAADRCALLVDGRCAVYEVRPMICRTHGLPSRTIDADGSSGIDVCPLNFHDVDPPAASLLALDAVNQPLAVMAELHDPGAPRVDLADLAARR